MKTITIDKSGGVTTISEDIGMAVALLPTGMYTVTIKRQRESTAAQFALLWAWMNVIARETGNKADDIYKYICHTILTHEVTVSGEKVTVDGSPKDLNKAQMTAFLDTVRNWAKVRWDIRLPQPGDRVFEQFMAKYG